MKNNDLDKLCQLSKEIKKLSDDQNYTYSKRKRRTNILDGLTFMLLQTRKDMSGTKATAVLNEFLSGDIKTPIDRSSFLRRSKQIPLELLEQVEQLTSKYLHASSRPHTTQVFAIDGSQINLNKKLSNDGLNLNKNKTSVNGLMLGIYNVTLNHPVCLQLADHKSERKILYEIIKDKKVFFEQNKDNIFVVDRGFFSGEFINILDTNGIKFVCRLKGNSKLIPANSMDCIVNRNQFNVRVVTYKIGEMKYYLCTNLTDTKEYPLEDLKRIYHSRWTIEEYFKHIKLISDLNNISETSLTEVKKHLLCLMIVEHIIHYIIKIHKPSTAKNSIINKAVLTEAVYNNILLRCMYNKKFSRDTLRRLIKNGIQFQRTQVGKSYPRVSSIPYTKWYVKKYYHKYVMEGKKGAHSKMAIKKMAATVNIPIINSSAGT